MYGTQDGPLLRGHGSSYRGLRYVWPRTVRDPDPPVWSGGPGNSYSEDPSQRRLRFKLDGLVTAEAQPHIRRLSNRWLSITGMIIHGHLTCRDSFGDIFTLTSGVEPTATSNSYIHETANLRSIASPASYIRTSGQAYPVDEEPTNWQVHLHGIKPARCFWDHQSTDPCYITGSRDLSIHRSLLHNPRD